MLPGALVSNGSYHKCLPQELHTWTTPDAKALSGFHLVQSRTPRAGSVSGTSAFASIFLSDPAWKSLSLTLSVLNILFRIHLIRINAKDSSLEASIADVDVRLMLEQQLHNFKTTRRLRALTSALCLINSCTASTFLRLEDDHRCKGSSGSDPVR